VDDRDVADVSSLAVNDSSNPVAIDGWIPRACGDRLPTERRLVAYPISADRLSIPSADAGRRLHAVNVELDPRGGESRWARLPPGHRLLFHECSPPPRARRRSGADPIPRVPFRTMPVVGRAIGRAAFLGVALCRVSRDRTIVRWRVRSRCRYTPGLRGFSPPSGRARASAENTHEREWQMQIRSHAVPLRRPCASCTSRDTQSARDVPTNPSSARDTPVTTHGRVSSGELTPRCRRTPRARSCRSRP
jgi:hypothetical protein